MPDSNANRLDSPPPAPVGVVNRVPPTLPTPAPSMTGMGMDPGSQNTLPQSVIQWGSMAEDSLTAISNAIPELTTPLAAVIDQIRKVVGGYIQSGGSAQPTAPQGLASILASAGAGAGASSGAPPAVGAA